MYCEKCSVLTDEKVCPICGNEKLRTPVSGDGCFLAEKDTT